MTEQETINAAIDLIHATGGSMPLKMAYEQVLEVLYPPVTVGTNIFVVNGQPNDGDIVVGTDGRRFRVAAI